MFDLVFWVALVSSNMLIMCHILYHLFTFHCKYCRLNIGISVRQWSQWELNEKPIIVWYHYPWQQAKMHTVVINLIAKSLVSLKWEKLKLKHLRICVNEMQSCGKSICVRLQLLYLAAIHLCRWTLSGKKKKHTWKDLLSASVQNL